MHNWWIATLEHLGLLTREEAQHISDNLKLGIHPEVYQEAYNSLSAILVDSPNRANIIKTLKADLGDLKLELDALVNPAHEETKAPEPAPVAQTGLAQVVPAPEPAPEPVAEADPNDSSATPEATPTEDTTSGVETPDTPAEQPTAEAAPEPATTEATPVEETAPEQPVTS